MTYTAIVNGKSVTLPPRILAIDEIIEEIKGFSTKYSKGEITYRELVQKQFDFVEHVAPNTFEDIEKVDTNDLVAAVSAIIKCYTEPTIKIQAEAILQQIRPLANSTEVNKIVGLTKLK